MRKPQSKTTKLLALLGAFASLALIVLISLLFRSSPTQETNPVRREMPEPMIAAAPQPPDAPMPAHPALLPKYASVSARQAAHASRAVPPLPHNPIPNRKERIPATIVVETRDEPSSAAPNVINRTKLVRAEFKYPLIRVEEKISVNPTTKAEEVTSSQAMVASHVLAQLQPGTTEAQLAIVAREIDATIEALPHSEGLYILSVPNPDIDAVPDAIAALGGHRTLLRFVEPDYIVYADQLIPNDTRFSELWGMHNTGQAGGTSDADIDAAEAWAVNVGNNTLVAVIDTGVDYLHEDLAGNMWTNPGETPGNGVDDDGNGHIDDVYGIDAYNNDADPMDDHGHGTHCSGTIAGVGNNSKGVAGVCWSARIMALKFLSGGGWGSSSDAITCIDYAISKGAVVMNNSWGGGGYSTALFSAIDRARVANSLFVAAAGNSAVNNDSSPHYPSSYTNANVLAVAASTRNDALSSFSCYGATSVDLAAPGSSILSCLPNDNYASWNGTSMATPHVAGAAALLLAQNTSLNVYELKQILMDNVDPIAAFAGKMVSGGRLNVSRAISRVFGISFDSPEYFSDTWATLTLTDTNFIGNTTQTVALATDAGDSETLVLVAKTPGGYVFTNRVFISYGAANPGNGSLEGVHGTKLYAIYVDPSTANTITGTATVALSLDIDITTPDTAVTFGTTNYAVSGINNGNVLVSMIVSNEATGDSAAFSATNAWTAPAVALANTTGRNVIHVFGTNIYGMADSDSVVITRYGPAGTNFVSPSGSHTWPYSDWATAATNINAAIGAAADSNLVLVTNGTYDTETIALDRPMTVSSVNGAAVTIIDGKDLRGCVSITADALISDFALTRGRASYGGGAYLEAGEVRNCLIHANRATYYGGGAYFEGDGLVSGSTVSNNTAIFGGAFEFYGGGTASNCLMVSNVASSYGGGADCWGGGTLIRCNIINNSCGWYGGGVECWEGGTLYNCRITGNHADYDGGGIESFYWGVGAVVYNTFIANNTAGRYGGGADCWGGGDFYNCTIVGNTGGTGGGLYCNSGGRVRNSIVYYNTSAAGPNYLNTGSSNQIFEFTCTTPAIAGTGNTTNAPLVAGIQDPHILPGSVCIDAGTNTYALGTDIDGEVRISNGTVDIGCDEWSGVTTGALSVAIETDATYAVPNYSIEFRGVISGFPSYFTWDFGGGPLLTNAPLTTQSWPGAGSYPVILTAYNTDNPGGVSATVTVQIADTTHYVSPAGSHTAPYDTWAKAANTIQAAIDACPYGGKVYVTNGSYNAGGYTQGMISARAGLYKPVSLLSVNGAANTFIVGQGPVGTSAVKCAYLTPGSLISGFTLTNGHTISYMGNTTHELYGGGAFMDGGGVISNSVIVGCASRYRAGGVYFNSGGEVVNSLIHSNYTRYYGGGVYLSDGGSLKHCTVVNNQAYYYGGGIYCSSGKEVLNSIVYHNKARYNSNIRTYGYSMKYEYTCTYPTNRLPGLTGCIASDPMLADTNTANYHLQDGSPCIDAANNIAGIDTDLDGFTRPLDGDTNGSSIADMGCYEFLPLTLDTDGDGMPDAWEIANGLDRLVNDAAGDLDGDGLTNLQEYLNGSDPNLTDTDGDGYSDLLEVNSGSDPADAASRPGTGVTIIIPTNSFAYTTTNATIDLGGTLSVPTAITSMSVSNSRHIFALSCPVAANWSFTNMPLYSGRNFIKVSATDVASNSVSDTILIERINDTGYNDILFSGAIVQEITMADNLVPGTTVPVQWKTLSYMPLRAQLGTGSKSAGWYLFKNAECLGTTGSPWNIKGRNANVYSYQANFVVPTNQGDFSIWFAHAQMDGGSYMSAVVPDGVDSRPDLVQSKLITRTIVAGGTNASPVSDTRYTDTVNPFESTSQALMRSGGTVVDINIPTNSWSVSNAVNCQWTVLSYVPIWSQVLMLDVSNKVVHLNAIGTQTGVKTSSWRLGSTYAKEYTFQANVTPPAAAVGTQQIYFLNMQQGVAGSSWMAGNIPAGIDPKPSIYNGMYGRFIDRTIAP